MTPERWQQAARIFEAALEREPDARGAFLVHACGDDRELRGEVESLLANEGAAALIDSSIWDLADDLLPGDAGFAPGAQVGPYRIEGVLGAGGMGQVYRARDTKLNRDVALKALPDVFTDDPRRLALFTREAHMLASLNHPGIAAIYGLEDAGGVHALVLELVEGPTLAERLERGPISFDEALTDRSSDRPGARGGTRAEHHSSGSQAGQCQSPGRRDREGTGLWPGESR